MHQLLDPKLLQIVTVTCCLAARLGFLAWEIPKALQSASLVLVVDALTHISAGVSLVLSVLHSARPQQKYQRIALDEHHGMALLVLVGLLALEALRRLFPAATIDGEIVVRVSLLSLLVHAALTVILARASRRDWRHGLAGNLLPAVVVPALALGVGGLTMATGWRWPDPIVSLLLLGAVGAGLVGLTIDRGRMPPDDAALW